MVASYCGFCGGATDTAGNCMRHGDHSSTHFYRDWQVAGEAVAEPSRELPELESPHFTPEQESYAANARWKIRTDEAFLRAEAAEARVALLEEKLAQFDAYGMPNVAAALDRVAALEKERDEYKAKYKLLCDAVSESDLDCSPGCDRYGHEEDCPHISNAASMNELQRQKAKAEKEAHALKEKVEHYFDGREDWPWIRGKLDEAHAKGFAWGLQKAAEAAKPVDDVLAETILQLSAGEHDQEGR